MAIDFNDNLQIRAPKPIDDRYGPWETIEEGLTNVPYPYRHAKLTLNIAGVEYWFKDGLEDGDLIIKEYGSGDSSKWEESTVLNKSIKYGRLYNWYTITDSRGLAPDGWHIPTIEDWNILFDFVGGIEIAGKKLKQEGHTTWMPYYNIEGTNDYLFASLPGGGWQGILPLGYYSVYLTSTNIDELTSRFISIAYYLDSSDIITGNKTSQSSIRLIKNNSINEGDIIIDGDTYNSVTIGNQVWLKQNLARKHYENGDLIGSDFNGTTGAVTAYNNDETNVYNFINGEDLVHIRPKYDKRIDASIIDNLPPSGTTLTPDQLQILNTVPLVCSDEKTDIVASLTESKIKFVFQTPQSFTQIIGELNTPAVGGTFTIDVTKNGVSILSTYLTFDSGETSTRTALIPKVLTTSPVSFDIGDYVEVFVRMVGALVPGKGLKIYLM